jgi:putative endonuclease
MSRYRQIFGRWGEDQAEQYLAQRGYQVIGRNIRTAYGELDLVCRQGDLLVFVEVKTRRNQALGFPEAAITPKKREHLLHSAQDYIEKNLLTPGNWRIDIISIIGYPRLGKPEIVHFDNAIVSDL